jgi:hypothetical protein
LRLPLNVDGNPWLAVGLVRAIRLKARQLADELDIVTDNGGPRKQPRQISTPPSLGALARFAAAEGFEITREFVEVETGNGSDALIGDQSLPPRLPKRVIANALFPR